MERITVMDGSRFTMRYYFQALTGILSTPRRFFSELPAPVGYQRPFGFLLVSSLFFTGASFLYIRESPFLMSGIFLLNALFMPLITSFIAFMAMTMSIGKRVPFERLFAVNAFASGVTLLVSWIPLSFWLTEPWKWLLVGFGMVKACGLGWKQTAMIILLSMGILILFFWSLAPAVARLRGISG